MTALTPNELSNLNNRADIYSNVTGLKFLVTQSLRLFINASKELKEQARNYKERTATTNHPRYRCQR
eukprot:CAMPEP_0196190546 /NCGR_PEP_ID=MMETSP0911-20130528/46534_1 /TAXON_ID=49265 /ORGANISM="Thalassiosira rotula, Strain GSO102" /LENGTH=66 /DNA_ID=CAMNT_0041462411 /DNA_START=21 /DNA_END=218 /DNA_ORIENTATION=-